MVAQGLFLHLDLLLSSTVAEEAALPRYLPSLSHSLRSLHLMCLLRRMIDIHSRHRRYLCQMTVQPISASALVDTSLLVLSYQLLRFRPAAEGLRLE